jgi:hypothetical protein
MVASALSDAEAVGSVSATGSLSSTSLNMDFGELQTGYTQSSRESSLFYAFFIRVIYDMTNSADINSRMIALKI